MTSVLSDRQKDELYVFRYSISCFGLMNTCIILHPALELSQLHSFSHKSLLSYLHTSGLCATFEALKKETENDDFEVNDPKARWVGLLEKKWTSVIRLQKKV